MSGNINSNSNRSVTTPYVSLEIQGGPSEQAIHDKNDDLTSLAVGSLTSVQTADGINDLPGYIIICAVILIGDMSRGMMFPTMWPLVESLGGTTVTLGYAVAAYSLGRIMSSPIFGAWSTTMGTKKTLQYSTGLLTLAFFTYAQVPKVGRPFFLIFSQTLVGAGSGSSGATRAFVADATATRQRTRYIAITTAVQYGGFTVTPFLGAFISHIFQDKEYQFGFFLLNKFTVPGYFMCILSSGVFLLLSTVFVERQRPIPILSLTSPKTSKPAKSSKRTMIDEIANTTTFLGLTTYDTCLLGCMLLNVATKGSIASFETIGINYAETQFGMKAELAGSIVATCGTVGVLSLLCMAHLSETFTDVQLITGGMAVTIGSMVCLCFVSEDTQDNETWKYSLAMFMMYSVGYPIGHTAVIGLFSKIVGRRKQGTLMGWFSASGSAARILCAIITGYVTNYASIDTLFFILMAILTTAIIFTITARKTLGLLSL
mmetsp:Transcript_17171/g.26577  ORF Transcript_17171/g.26577 Transcript_17171/m.26577 type:complete len:487 (+) Transcript_17171:44-1504(+)